MINNNNKKTTCVRFNDTVLVQEYDDHGLNYYGRYARASHMVKVYFGAWAKVTQHRRAYRWTCIRACKLKMDLDTKLVRRCFQNWVRVVHRDWHRLRYYLHYWAEWVHQQKVSKTKIRQADLFFEYHLKLRMFETWKMAAVVVVFYK